MTEMTPVEFAKGLILNYDMQNLSFPGKENLITEITQYTAAIRQAARDEALDDAASTLLDTDDSEAYSYALCFAEDIKNLKSQPAEKGE